MFEQSTEIEQPAVKRADALETGDAVMGVAEYGKPPQPLKVLLAHPYRDGDGIPMVALSLDAYTQIDGFAPIAMYRPAGETFEMADEQDLAVFREAGRRQEFATALRQLADAIEVGRLPVPLYSVFMSGCMESRADLEVWAEHLGVEIKAGGTDGTIPVVDKDVSAPEDGPKLNVRWQAPSEPKPAPEVEPVQEWLFTFGSGQQHDGRFVRITGTHESARARMVEVFGNRWCAQYDWQGFDHAGLPAVLTELPDSEWTAAEIVAGVVAALDGPAVACPCLEPSDSDVLADIPAQRSGE